MTSSSTILFCGGGSAGHVAPSLAVAQAVTERRKEARMVFLCAEREEEADLLRHAGVRFHTLHSLRISSRGFLRVLTFLFSFAEAFSRSLLILCRERPDVVFSKGGAVSVPVCFAAWCRRIPIVLHESDSVLSRSTTLLARFAQNICTGFPLEGLPPCIQRKVIHTGNPVRGEILQGNRAAGQRITRFSGRRPVLLIMGGSQGASALNEAVERSFEELVDCADIIHLTGKGKTIGRTHARYFARPFVAEELPHLYALADLVVSRAGAGALSELAALAKAAIVVPLTGLAHDHQLRNAEMLATRGAVELLPQEQLSLLAKSVTALLRDDGKRRQLGGNLARVFPPGAASRVAQVLLDVL